MDKTSLKKVAAAIRKYNRFLVSVHTSPEGDAIGSELGLYNLLKKLGKQAFVVNEDPLPQEYSLLPGKENIRVYKPNFKDIDFDCLVVLDCSDLSRIGLVADLNKEKKPVINIDHHISNTRFADFNWVEPRASSASEMVFNIYQEMRLPLDKETALLLYVGILTDTGSFRYSNTTSATHMAVAELLSFGIDVNWVYKEIYENIPFTDLHLLAKILSHIHRACGGRIAWVEIPARLIRHEKIAFDLTDHILSFIRAIKGTEVAALFKENLGVRNEIRFNLRSRGEVDVNKIAQAFGGGGHKTASGCTMSGRLVDVRRKVIAKIRKELK